MISVIIPIFKVEKYLNKCIDSVINQTYKNLEIILVNDGSPDNCGNICDEYAKKDSRIIVVHKENGGLSDARNAGLDVCGGEQIVFVDSDDYIELDMIETMYKSCIENESDLVICSHRLVDENDIEVNMDEIVNVDTECKTDCIKALHYNVDFIVAWSKLYSRSFFEKRRFQVGKIHEDEFIAHEIIYEAEKITYIKKTLYNYRKHSQSITGINFSIKNLDACEAFDNRLNYFLDKGEMEIAIKAYFSLIAKFLQAIRLLDMKNIDNKAKIQNIKKMCNENYKKVDKSKITLLRRIYVNLACKCPRVTLAVMSIYRIIRGVK